MGKFSKVNNERSEAIELIKVMDSVAKQNTWQIKSVGGESTLNTGKRRMFPDVFVYGDTARTQVLHGWEVKMPDVLITDDDFIKDAWRKADVLGVNSCIIWNFTHGVLYVKKTDGWTILKQWNDTSHIKKRADVSTYKADWELLISSMMSELNSFFLSGELSPSRIGDIVADTVFSEIIKRNKGVTGEYLRTESAKNTVILAHISQWWSIVSGEYKFDEPDKFYAYAKYILLNWINKITFANMIKGNHNPASIVETIDEEMEPAAALKIFEEITLKCDFFNVFEPVAYGELLPVSTWMDLTDYNAFLANQDMAQVSHSALQIVLENSVNQFKRNISGVFTTPERLARILVNAGIIDLTAPAIDPCCGTGTIAKEILSTKENAIGVKKAFETTFASDKSPFALQVSNIAMTKASAMRLPSLLFRANAFDLSEGKVVQITDPNTGDLRQYTLPKWGSVLSNLPFVAFDQEGREEELNIDAIINSIQEESGITLSGRLDLYQALLLGLNKVLDEKASVAVITSNSWLGTLAGQDFFCALGYYYDIDCIVSSGNGKWFDNADVVTLMLFLKNKSSKAMPRDSHMVSFGQINTILSTLTDEGTNQIINSIKLRQSDSPDLLSLTSYSFGQINELLEMNIALNSLFYDVDWLLSLKDILCPITDLYEIIPGVKTGHDDIFFLPNADCVDPQYVGYVFKTAKECEYLLAQADKPTLVCDKTIEELTTLGHIKTIAWINRFYGNVNQSVPNKDTFWMNLGDKRFPDNKKVRLFAPMNPERRIFYGLLDKPEKINQRATGFKPIQDNVNLELSHALLNSIIGIFYTEAMGFPKGLGALDTRRKNTEKMLMLDPRRLSSCDIDKILKTFTPLLSRKIMSTFDEYQQIDRLNFERTVADCFGYSALFDRIKDSVISMQKVRLSVKAKR